MQSGSKVVDDVDEALQAWNITLESSGEVSDDFEVWPENWDTLLLFVRLCNGSEMWMRDPGGFRLGIDYGQLRSLCSLLGVSISIEQAEDFREMAKVIVEHERRSCRH